MGSDSIATTFFRQINVSAQQQWSLTPLKTWTNRRQKNGAEKGGIRAVLKNTIIRRMEESKTVFSQKL